MAEDAERLMGLALQAKKHDMEARKFARLGRMHAVLSAVDTVAEDMRSVRALLQAACRLAVEEGGFGAAWAALYDAEGHRVRAVATEGLGPFAIANPLVLNGTPSDGTMLARAIATGEPIACNNIAKVFLPSSPVRQQAMRRALKSMAICPLHTGEAVTAVLTVLAREADAFDQDEVRLLEQLAADLSSALTGLERAAA
jgi:GAF domain-containing protein